MQRLILILGFISVFTWAQVPPQPVFNIENINGTVTLPTGASTEATQVNVLAAVQAISPGGVGTFKLQDGNGNPVTSQASAGQRALDIGIDVSGVQVDPRTRLWTLAFGTDSVTSDQGGIWTVQPGNTANTTPWLFTIATQLPSGSNTIGAVNQGSSPWVENVSQFGGTNLSTGTGVSGAGIPRVTVSNDSNILSTQSGAWNVGLNAGSNTIGSVKITDGTNQAAVTASNAVKVDGSGVTQPISGTITANQGGTWTVQQGTPPWSVSQSGIWNITNITGTISLPIGASTSANQTNGSQKTQVVDGSGIVQGPAQTISGTNYMPVVLAASAAPNAALVARSIQIAGSDGTNAQTISVDGTGRLNVNNISGTVSLPAGASTAAGQSATQPRNITQFGGTNISTGTGAGGLGIPRVTVSNDSNILSTQSGVWTVQPGNTANTTPWLVSVATALPTGANTIGAVTQASGPWTQNITQVGGSSVTLGAKASTSSIPVVLSSDQPGINKFLDGSVNGSITALNGSISIPSNGSSNFSINITGTWTAILSFQGSNDQGVTFPFTIECTIIPTGVLAPTTTVNNKFLCPSSGFSNVRVIATSFTSGSASIALESSAGTSLVQVYQPNASSFLVNAYTFDGSGNSISSNAGSLNNNLTQFNGTTLSTGTGAGGAGIPRVTVSNDSNVLATQSGIWTVQQGSTPTTLANAWPVKPTDGTNAITVKAASTPAAAGDTSQVMALSPNSPLPSGGNTVGAVTQASGPWTINLTQIGGSSITLGEKIEANSIPVTIASDQTEKTATGNITAACVYTSGVVSTCGVGSTVQINSIGTSTIQFGTSGTWVATMTQDISYDPLCTSTPNAVIWFNQPTFDIDPDQSIQLFQNWTVTQNNDPWVIQSAATQCVRLRASVFTSGTVVVQMTSGQGVFHPPIHDGVTSAVIKPASTAAAASDPALVIAQSPNSPTPVGTNLIGATAPVDGLKTTYRAAFTGLVTAAAATDVFTMTGSATKTIRVTAIGFYCNATTAGTQDLIFLKRSTANSGGTSTSRTAVSMDSSDAAATGTVLTYTANPTTGTLVGSIMAHRTFFQVAAPGGNAPAFPLQIYEFGQRGKAPVLRGTSQVFALNLNGGSITGPICDGWIEWTEE